MELKDFILENWDKTIREVKEPVNRLRSSFSEC